MLEGIICPVCENTLEEVDLQDSLVCPHCRADLKSRKFLDFLDHYSPFIARNDILVTRHKDSALKQELITENELEQHLFCLLYTSPSPRDATLSRMPSSA